MMVVFAQREAESDGRTTSVGRCRIVPRGLIDDLDGWARLLDDSAAEHDSVPRRICQLCVQMLSATGAGISMVTNAGNRGVVCATDDVSARVEDLQFTLGEGPCVDAAHFGTPILVPDLNTPDDIVVDRWPAFMEGAGAAGVRAIFAFPLRIGAINVGVLDVYRSESGPLRDGELRAALLAADAAALALLDVDTAHDDLFSDNVEVRSAYQLQVHQATGILQVQLGVPTEQAFLMLRARAFALGRPLVDVATDVVGRRLRFSVEDQ
jgi:GAF domain-containing protein